MTSSTPRPPSPSVAPADAGWVADVERFWFEEVGPTRWFVQEPELDARVRARFLGLWTTLQQTFAAHDPETPAAKVAAVVLFDQFPRNMFRGRPEMVATDPLARRIARAAVEAGVDRGLDQRRRHMLYMPFMHSEDRADQAVSVRLFEGLGDANLLPYALQHAEVIERFGRFPHRNATLGRASTAEELAYLRDHPQ